MRRVRDEWSYAEIQSPVFDRMAELRSRYFTNGAPEVVDAATWLGQPISGAELRRAAMAYDRPLWIACGLLFLAGGLATPFALLMHAGVSFTTYLIFLSFMIAIALMARTRAITVATPTELAMNEEAAEIEVAYHLVEVRLKGLGGKVEMDRGIVWFEQDALLFCGRRCSFVFGTQDIERWWTKPRFMMDLRGNRSHIELRALAVKGKDYATAKRLLNRDLATFAVVSRPTPLKRQYPPVVV